MVECKLCNSCAPHYLYTTCEHTICLPCCYLETDFVTCNITCCGVTTPVGQDAIAQIIRNKRPVRKQTQPQQETPPPQHQSSPLKVSNRREAPLQQSKWEELITDSFHKEPVYSRNKSHQIYASQENQPPNFSKNNSKQLENILLLQIQKVKRQFDLQHQLLRKKEDAIIKDLMNAYEDEIKNIQRPIATAKLENFDLSMGRFNSRVQENIRSHRLKQQRQVEPSENGNNHYDNIIKKLEINQQRMTERLQGRLKTLA